jgi:hypothetical protein
MPNRNTIIATRPASGQGHVRRLRQGPHGPGSPLFDEVARQSLDFEVYHFDFGEASAAESIGATKFWQYAESTGTITDFAKLTPTAAKPSVIQGSTEATNGQNMELVGPKMFISEAHPWIEVCFAINQTNVELTMGFVGGTVPASAGPILGDIDTPTLAGGVGPSAFIGLDRAETLQTAALLTYDGTTVRRVNVGPTSAPFGVPTPGTYVIYRVELRNGKAYVFINGSLVAESVDDAVSTTTLMAPVVFFGTRAASILSPEIDYINVGQERITAQLT